MHLAGCSELGVSTSGVTHPSLARHGVTVQTLGAISALLEESP